MRLMDERTERLLYMVSRGLLEMRRLCAEGKSKQAWALADALHNVPSFILSPESWEPEYFTSILGAYQDEYNKPDACCRNDYVAQLVEVEQ